MILTSALTGSHLRTYQTIFQHPVSHNLAWLDVHALMRQVGLMEEAPNGSHKVTRNGHRLVLRAQKTKDVGSTEELMVLRHFLEQSETATPASESQPAHLLLVIDHHEARLFHAEVIGGIPENFLPHKPEDYFRHAHHSKDFSRGQEKPDPNSFFEPVAKALQGASQILIFGTGTGMGSAMVQFIGWLEIHHPELTKRIIDSVVVDEHHLTDGQLLAKARECYAKVGRAH